MLGSQPTVYRDERLAVLVTFVVLGVALSALIPLPARAFVLDLFGSELSLRFSGPVQVLIILAALVCAGVDSLVRYPSAKLAPALLQSETSAPQTGLGSALYRAAFWSLPTTLTVIGLVLVHTAMWWGYQIALSLLVGLSIAVIIVAQLATHTLDTPRRRTFRLALNGLVYVLALMLFGLIFGARLRSLLSATATVLTSGLLAVELYRNSETPSWRIWLYAALTALIMGQLTWALNYTRFNAQTGSALLLLAFYVLTGLVQQNLWNRMSSRVITEYLAILSMGLLAIAILL